MARRPFSASTRPTTPPSSADPDASWRELRRLRREDGDGVEAADAVAVEEPLEVRVRGTALAVLMRTPGRDRALIAGFLASEGVIRGPRDLGAVERCPDPQTGAPAANVWNAALAEGVPFDPRERRFLAVGSSCGLCGARTLEALERVLPGLAPAIERVSLAELHRAFAVLGRDQEAYRRTAGCHGAALWRPGRGLLEIAEDVGRHNAVDKVLGARLLAGDYPLEESAGLLLSGRVSFELVQKAALAGVPLVAGVGMPTTLAVEAARAAGITLLGWVRDGGASRYSGGAALLP